MTKKEKEDKKPEQNAEEMYDKFLRAKAELDNYRKRVEKEKRDLMLYTKEDTLQKLLPLYDIILKAEIEINSDKDNTTEHEKLEKITTGLNMVFAEFTKLFKTEHITKMDCLNKPYNHEQHEVLTTIPTTKEKDGLVLEEIEKGFMIGEKVLRTAKVVVGKTK